MSLVPYPSSKGFSKKLKNQTSLPNSSLLRITKTLLDTAPLDYISCEKVEQIMELANTPEYDIESSQVGHHSRGQEDVASDVDQS